MGKSRAAARFPLFLFAHWTLDDETDAAETFAVDQLQAMNCKTQAKIVVVVAKFFVFLQKFQVLRSLDSFLRLEFVVALFLTTTTALSLFKAGFNSQTNTNTHTKARGRGASSSARGN